MKKKCLALICAVSMMVTMVPFTAMADTSVKTETATSKDRWFSITKMPTETEYGEAKACAGAGYDEETVLLQYIKKDYTKQKANPEQYGQSVQVVFWSSYYDGITYTNRNIENMIQYTQGMYGIYGDFAYIDGNPAGFAFPVIKLNDFAGLMTTCFNIKKDKAVEVCREYFESVGRYDSATGYIAFAVGGYGDPDHIVWKTSTKKDGIVTLDGQWYLLTDNVDGLVEGVDYAVESWYDEYSGETYYTYYRLGDKVRLTLFENGKDDYIILSYKKIDGGHSHNFKKTVVTAPCTGKGKEHYKCGCGIEFDNQLPTKEHSIVVDKAVAATVLKTGKTAGKHCSVCNKVIVAQKTVAKLKPTVKLSSTKKTLKVKKSFVLTISKLAKGDSVKSVKSSKTKIVSVKKKEKNKYTLTSKKKGKATVTVTLASGKKATCKVTVK